MDWEHLYLQSLGEDFENACPTLGEILFLFDSMKEEKKNARLERNRISAKLSRENRNTINGELQKQCQALELENRLLRARNIQLERDNIAMHHIIHMSAPSPSIDSSSP
jgi:hypothetical protein